MIKIIFCLRRLPTLSAAEFQHYWLHDHGARVRENAKTSSIRRYTQSHTLHDPRLEPILKARGSMIEPFDGIAEAWWDDVDSVLSVAPTPERLESARATLKDEAQFIDLANSVIFFAEEHVVYAA